MALILRGSFTLVSCRMQNLSDWDLVWDVLVSFGHESEKENNKERMILSYPADILVLVEMLSGTVRAHLTL